MMTFKNWILEFIDVNLPIGDLAKDVNFDNNFPNTSDKEVISEYLQNQGAFKDALETFEHSWKLYSSSR
ncbi:sterile alpha motif-like domain-containing protein [Gemella sp. GL1.1]|nr:sterile alpha motif-like domain-containing protein [Gemella sp. GL1.1]NYS27102.1 sterile alpha motif-like domain-containing protein [Gemella sp. GL1]